MQKPEAIRRSDGMKVSALAPSEYVRKRTEGLCESADSEQVADSITHIPLQSFASMLAREETPIMNIRFQPLVRGLLIGAAAAILVTGCNRQDTNPTGEAGPTETTMGTELDDTVLTTKVKSALLADENVKGLEIQVETRKGRVLLSGFVDDKARADHAISVARAVEGVTGVDNGMTIKEGNASVGNTLDDSVLTAKVKSALMSDASIRSGDISVATRKGEVQLSGFVDSQEQIERAVIATRSVEGVQIVVNAMSVKK